MHIVAGIIFVLLGFGGFYYLYKKTGDFLNPFGITVLVWLVVAGFASFRLSYLQTAWSFLMYLVVLLFPATVFLVGTVKTQYRHKRLRRRRFHFSEAYLIFSRVVFAVCVLCSVLEWIKQGLSVPLFMDTFDAKAQIATIPVIHYGTIFLPYCVIASVYELLYREVFGKWSKLYLISSIAWPLFHALCITVSRGTLLIVAMGVLFITVKGLRIRLRVVVVLLCAVVFAFVLLGRVRINSASLVFNVVEGYPLFSALYSYAALGFENLNRLVTKGPALTICTQSLWGVFECFGLTAFMQQIPSEVTEFFNAPTLCYDFYEDLGVVGVIVFPALIYGIIRLIYVKTQHRREYILLLATLQKAIWMTFFGNYFTSHRVDLFPYLVTFLFVLMLEKGDVLLTNSRIAPLYEKYIKNTKLGEICAEL